MEAAASGFLLKDAPASELAAAIRRAAQGGRVVDPAPRPRPPTTRPDDVSGPPGLLAGQGRVEELLSVHNVVVAVLADVEG
jgi:DNA-binding NarL/FixJ family response regulator